MEDIRFQIKLPWYEQQEEESDKRSKVTKKPKGEKRSKRSEKDKVRTEPRPRRTAADRCDRCCYCCVLCCESVYFAVGSAIRYHPFLANSNADRCDRCCYCCLLCCESVYFTIGSAIRILMSVAVVALMFWTALYVYTITSKDDKKTPGGTSNSTNSSASNSTNSSASNSNNSSASNSNNSSASNDTKANSSFILRSLNEWSDDYSNPGGCSQSLGDPGGLEAIVGLPGGSGYLHKTDSGSGSFSESDGSPVIPADSDNGSDSPRDPGGSSDSHGDTCRDKICPDDPGCVKSGGPVGDTSDDARDTRSVSTGPGDLVDSPADQVDDSDDSGNPEGGSIPDDVVSFGAPGGSDRTSVESSVRSRRSSGPAGPGIALNATDVLNQLRPFASWFKNGPRAHTHPRDRDPVPPANT